MWFLILLLNIGIRYLHCLQEKDVADVHSAEIVGIRKGTEYRADEIEPLVFKKYGRVEGIKILLQVAAKRPSSRNFAGRVERLYGCLL